MKRKLLAALLMGGMLASGVASAAVFTYSLSGTFDRGDVPSSPTFKGFFTFNTSTPGFAVTAFNINAGGQAFVSSPSNDAAFFSDGHPTTRHISFNHATGQHTFAIAFELPALRAGANSFGVDAVYANHALNRGAGGFGTALLCK